ncbi:MAG TPA: DNA polymerase III subunit chi [Gammaproteobacteria bacterium]|nr:DNA polymerase III subunit chi [Gammaproteobacteria bacterium]
MTRIDFYILNEKARHDRFFLSCRITEKAWHQKHRIMIQANSEQEARHMNQLLWTFRDQSFIPHELLPQADLKTTPVVIGWGDDAADECDVLINLATEIPPFFSRFERLVEIVDHDLAHKQVSRDHYRYYQERGYPLTNHKL